LIFEEILEAELIRSYDKVITNRYSLITSN